MLSERSIVVTGMGVASAAGHSPEDLWRAVVRGLSPAVAFSDPTSPGSPTIPACVAPGPDAAAISLRPAIGWIGASSSRSRRPSRAGARRSGHELSGPWGAGCDRGHLARADAKVDREPRPCQVRAQSTAADPGGQQYARRPERCASRRPWVPGRLAAQRPDRGGGDAATTGRSPARPGGVQLDQAGDGSLPGRIRLPWKLSSRSSACEIRSPHRQPTASTSTRSVASTS